MIPSEFQSLANHLWQSTLFAAVAGLLTLALRKNRARIRYSLWLAASVKFLIPFSLLVDIGSEFAGRAAHPISPPLFASVIQEAGQPFSAPTLLASTTAMPANPFATWIPAVILAIWATGVATLVCSWCRRWRRISATLRTASPIDLHCGIATMVSPGFAEPGIFGVLRPILLLPAGITEYLAPAELKAIVAHELCHIRRRDNLTTAIHMSVEALFWFHPLVWWLGARLMVERERACDEEVLSSGSEPRPYAEGILKICERYLESPLACVSGVSGASLKNRVESIMLNRTPARLSPAKNTLLAVVAAGVLAGPVVVGITTTATTHAQPQVGAEISVKPPRFRFEAASIKPSPRPTQHIGIVSNAARVDIGNWSILQLIVKAYSLQTYQLLGPDWMGTIRFDVQASLPQGSNQQQIPEMLQALLAERFGLVVHAETKELAGFGLTVGKGGLKMKPVAPNSNAYKEGVNILDELWGSGKAFGASVDRLPNGDLRMDFQQFPIRALAQFLSSNLRAPVTDLTALDGTYHVTLDFDPMSVANLSPANEASSGDLFAAVARLGLKLERQSVRCNVLVVDHVAQAPTAN